ncbi:YqzE family protein [Bacillus cytotoxicus]
MSTNDYVRFVTQQFVSYMDDPKEDRKQKKERRRAEKAPFLNRWFGMMPLSAALLYQNVKKEKKKIKLITIGIIYR